MAGTTHGATEQPHDGCAAAVTPDLTVVSVARRREHWMEDPRGSRGLRSCESTVGAQQTYVLWSHGIEGQGLPMHKVAASVFPLVDAYAQSIIRQTIQRSVSVSGGSMLSSLSMGRGPLLNYRAVI